MKFIILLMSLILTSSLVLAASSKNNRKYRARKAKPAYAAKATVYSMEGIIRHLVYNPEKISVILPGDETNFFSLADRNFGAILAEHRENRDKVLWNKFRCKATDVAAILRCRLIVVESLKKGEVGLTAYNFKVGQDAKGAVKLLAPLDAVVVDGNRIPDEATLVEFLDPKRNEAEFRAFAN